MKGLKIFRNSRVIVTGHTGFKGSWLTAWLKQLGAKVMGISLDPPTYPSHFGASKINLGIKDVRLDIRDKVKLEQKITAFKPNFVFHLAAQSLVGLSYKNPITTWQTNVFGTLNILESLRKLKNVCNVVIITSDKCYFNREIHYGYKETDILGGKDPYSGSKASAELLVKSYISSFFLSNKPKIRIATARAGNVIGGGDWANNRIIPDCVRSWSKNKKAELRNPNATRPWQHVLEAVGGYLCLAINLRFNKHLHGEAFNFGPNPNVDQTVAELLAAMATRWPGVQWQSPEAENEDAPEATLLKLSCDKALFHLGWRAVLDFSEVVTFTVDWYHTWHGGEQDMHGYTIGQIEQYQALATTRGLPWVQE